MQIRGQQIEDKERRLKDDNHLQRIEKQAKEENAPENQVSQPKRGRQKKNQVLERPNEILKNTIFQGLRQGNTNLRNFKDDILKQFCHILQINDNGNQADFVMVMKKLGQLVDRLYDILFQQSLPANKEDLFIRGYLADDLDKNYFMVYKYKMISKFYIERDQKFWKYYLISLRKGHLQDNWKVNFEQFQAELNRMDNQYQLANLNEQYQNSADLVRVFIQKQYFSKSKISSGSFSIEIQWFILWIEKITLNIGIQKIRDHNDDEDDDIPESNVTLVNEQFGVDMNFYPRQSRNQ
ncbi:UNKNOWN [Stylonychia lemnae]|uniref:Uncharacterized protein n=1 Tax=Stylonychia lemnae TaxID=5949 RepID=A0A077ZYE4_STYLE|nr:UNKNOWN [Stylonychia lemnae]|eukprot:CDW74951.1 UNKNOWN [Stylonychia lemnae]